MKACLIDCCLFLPLAMVRSLSEGKLAGKDKIQPPAHRTVICARAMSIHNFQKHKESGNIQSQRAGHSPIVTVHTVTVINVILLTSECFTFKEKFIRLEERTTFPKRHTDHWLGHYKKLTLSQRFKFIYLILYIYAWRYVYIHWRWYARITICMEVKDNLQLFPPHSSLGSNSGGQHSYQDLYSLSHLCSPINWF